MEFSRTQIAIAAGAGVLLLLIFFGYLMWLNGQGPVLARSEERDPLSNIPNSISLNPLRDRTSEREANRFIRAIHEGHCDEKLADWKKDYRKKYAAFICDSEGAAPIDLMAIGGVGGYAAVAHPALSRQTLQYSRPEGHIQRTLVRDSRKQIRRVGRDQVRLHVLNQPSDLSLQ